MTIKEQVWLAEYIKCRFNATEAARRAGYKWPDKQGAQIKERLKGEIKVYLDDHALSPEAALYLLSEQATASHADLADVNMRDDLKGHPKAHVVKTVVTDTYEDAKGKIHHKMKIELYDAQRALEDILKIHGKFKETVTNLNYDLSKATDEQLQRIAAGEDPATVLQQNPTTGGG